MALFKLLKGQEKNLPTNKTEGWAYVTTDEGNMYVDVSATKRVKIGAHADTAISANRLISAIAFTPAETALTPANVKTLIGTGSQIRKGSWSYAGNGYIASGTTATSSCPYGAIDLAGTMVIQSETGSQYTQIYITPPTASTSGAIKGEMLYYIDQGTGYSPTWYRVLTDKNYTSYTVKKDGTGASGTWGISISGNAATATKATQDGNGNVISSTYLKLSGGTMTGTINSQIIQPKTNNTYTLGGSSNRWSTLYSVNIDNTGTYTWYGGQNFALKATANNQEWSFDQCSGSTSYTGTYSHFWSAKNSVSIIRFYTDDNQVQIPSTGFMGIGGAGNASYKLKVTGNTYLTGTLYTGGASIFNSNLTVNSSGKIKVQNTNDSSNSQDSNASIVIQGGISVTKQLSAKSIRVDNNFSDKGCTIKFNNDNNCIEFVFD